MTFLNTVIAQQSYHDYHKNHNYHVAIATDSLELATLFIELPNYHSEIRMKKLIYELTHLLINTQ